MKRSQNGTATVPPARRARVTRDVQEKHIIDRIRQFGDIHARRPWESKELVGEEYSVEYKYSKAGDTLDICYKTTSMRSAHRFSILYETVTRRPVQLSICPGATEPTNAGHTEKTIVRIGRVILRAMSPTVDITLDGIPQKIIKTFFPIVVNRPHLFVSTPIEIVAHIMGVSNKRLVSDAMRAFEAKFYVPTKYGVAFQNAIMTQMHTSQMSTDAPRWKLLVELASIAYRTPCIGNKGTALIDCNIHIADIMQRYIPNTPTTESLRPVREWRAYLRYTLQRIASLGLALLRSKKRNAKELRTRAIKVKNVSSLIRAWSTKTYKKIHNLRKSAVNPQAAGNIAVSNPHAVNEAIARYMSSVALRVPHVPVGHHLPAYLYRGMHYVGGSMTRFGYIDWLQYIATSIEQERAEYFLGGGRTGNHGTQNAATHHDAIMLQFNTSQLIPGTPWIFFESPGTPLARRRHGGAVAEMDEGEVLFPPGRIVLVPLHAHVARALEAAKYVANAPPRARVPRGWSILRPYGIPTLQRNSPGQSLHTDATQIATLMSRLSKDAGVQTAPGWWDTPENSTLWLSLALSGVNMAFAESPKVWKRTCSGWARKWNYSALLVPDTGATSMSNPNLRIAPKLYPAPPKRNIDDRQKTLAAYEQLWTLFNKMHVA